MEYFARVTAGLEEIAWQDISGLGAELLGFGHRRIDFSHAGPPAMLLRLLGVDDVYVFADLLDGLDHTRASLGELARQIAGVDFGPAVARCAAVRPLSAAPGYRITASHLGRRNYSRYDVEAAVAQALAGRWPWRHLPNRDTQTNPAPEEPELDLRILLEDDWALVGLRLSAQPLHRRPYKLASTPGSLKPPVAFCLCLMAALHPADRLLDPTCGAGTIVIESAALLTAGLSIGGELDPAAFAAAERNLALAGLDRLPAAALADPATFGRRSQPAAILYQGDARQPNVPPASIDAVVANLPWDQQVRAPGDVAADYAAILAQIELALAPGGRAVLLTTQDAALDAALSRRPGLRLASRHAISLFGAQPTISLLRQTR